MRIVSFAPGLLLALSLTGTVPAQVVDSVSPREPERGAVVGSKPKLRVEVDGKDWTKMQFRIELSNDDFETVLATFDQQREPNGWVFVGLGADTPGAIYQVRQALPDGELQWRVAAWNGVDWVPGKRPSSFRVDATPPAAVDRIRMSIGPGRSAVRLEWDPVVLDEKGRPELVARYHVYRYERRYTFSSYGAYEIGVTEDTSFEDRDRVALDGSPIFYKVSAEDAAGNETDKRHY